MIKCIIIDDEKDSIEYISSVLDGIPEISIVSVSQSVKDGVKCINKYNPDIVLLDIELVDGSGFDIIDQFHKTNFQVLFITAYSHYAIKAIKYSAFDYIQKPVDVEELTSSLRRLIKQVRTKKYYDKQVLLDNIFGNKQKLAINTESGIFYINIDEIIRIEAAGVYSTIYTCKEKQLVCTKNIKYFETLLDDGVFIRIHKSHIVNIIYTEALIKKDGGGVLLKNGDLIPISRDKRGYFQQFMQKLIK